MLTERSGRGVVYLGVSLLLAVLQAYAQPAPAGPAAVEQRVQSVLSQMTLEEKIDMLGGVDNFFIRDLTRLYRPRVNMAHGQPGVRAYSHTTTMAARISLAATWNPHLADSVNSEIGRAARAKGVQFLLT